MARPPAKLPIGVVVRDWERRQRRWASIERAIGWGLIGFAIGWILGSMANAV